MNAYKEKLIENNLFRNLSEQDYKTLLEPDDCILGRYQKGTLIMRENEPCRSIGFVLEGVLSVQQISPLGEMIRIATFRPGDCFGLVLIYSSSPSYPYTLVAHSSASVLYIPFEKIAELLGTSTVFNANYIALLSDRVLMFQDKIRILSQRDVRSRLILYFANQADKAKDVCFLLTHSKTEIADLVGVTRPSVSRELKHMQEDGLLTLDRNVVTLSRPKAFNLRF